MPIYDYQCTQCGATFDKMLLASERDEAEKTLTCPECGNLRPRRLISSFATGSANQSAAPNCPIQASGGCTSGG